MLTLRIRKTFRDSHSPEFILDVSAALSPGFTILFGPSGSGKSSLLDCIAGLATPQEGKISCGELVFFDSSAAINLRPQRRGVAYVFQSLALFPHLSVEANVAYGLAGIPKTDSAARVQSALQSFHVEHLRHRKPAALSGGEKQRVALARSLVTRPRLLLLDEPLTGLEAGLKRSILQDLREWNASNSIPILYVTHNREEVDALSERVLVMENGKLLAAGSPLEVLDAPRKLALASAAGYENLFPAKILEHRPQEGVTRVALDSSNCTLEVPLSTLPAGKDTTLAIRAGDILLATEHPRGLSARNVIAGTLASLEKCGSYVKAEIDCGARCTAHLTPGAIHTLALAPGQQVWLVLKTHSCHLLVG